LTDLVWTGRIEGRDVWVVVQRTQVDGVELRADDRAGLFMAQLVPEGTDLKTAGRALAVRFARTYPPPSRPIEHDLAKQNLQRRMAGLPAISEPTLEDIQQWDEDPDSSPYPSRSGLR
jgi:hypothetical protein